MSAITKIIEEISINPETFQSIVENVSPDTINFYKKLINLSELICEKVIKDLNVTARVGDLPIFFKTTRKTYAVDFLVISKYLGLEPVNVKNESKIYFCFYLLVHLIDDYIEEKNKLKENIIVKGNYGGEGNLLFPVYLCLKEAITKYSENNPEYTKNDVYSIGRDFDQATSTIYALLLKEQQKFKAEDILGLKVNEISAFSSRFIFSALPSKLTLKYPRLREGCEILGRMVQLTDDLRDYEKDVKIGTNNVIYSKEKEVGSSEKALTYWKNQYLENHKKFSGIFQKFGQPKLNIEILEFVPFYPFFKKLLRQNSSN